MNKMFIGALSGTSMDAIDVAAVDFSEPQPRLLACANYPIAKDLAAQVKHLQSNACHITEYAQMDYTFGKLFADCINDFIEQQDIAREAIVAVGLHGQTVVHDTHRKTPITLQIADPNVVAYQTRMTVVADFRRADIAAGGQGAPLASPLHALLFAKADNKQAVVNIGGIANITVLDGTQVAAGFDSGPGNCLMDAWIQKHKRQAYDEDGSWAAAHTPNAELLRVMLEEPFFAKSPPKSTCTGYFSLDWLDEHLQKRKPLADGVVAATLAELTAATIAGALAGYTAAGNELLVCGGGAHNRHLLARLGEYTRRRVHSTADKGIDPDWIEAIVFAWLAKQRLENRSGSIPEVTGASEAAVLGAIYRSL